MMLAGPGIQHRTSIGTTARVLMYVDASASMKATDEQMELSRKLGILNRLGWLEGGENKMYAGNALARLGELKRVLTAMAVDTAKNLPQHVEKGETLAQQTAKHLEGMQIEGWTEEQLDAFKKEVLNPFLKVDPVQADVEDKAALLSLQPGIGRWEETIRGLLPKGAAALEKMNPETRAAIERFDRTPRFRIHFLQRRGPFRQQTANSFLPSSNTRLKRQQCRLILYIGLDRIHFKKGIQHLLFKGIKLFLRPAFNLHSFQMLCSLLGESLSFFDMLREIFCSINCHSGEHTLQFTQSSKRITRIHLILPSFQPS
jgi:hypothetical protein